MAATTDTFVRLLARFEAPLLRRHCDEELDEQLRGIRAAVRELVACGEQLRTVREAAARLDAGHATASCSAAALGPLLEDTAELQRAIGDALERLIGAMRAPPPAVEPNAVDKAVNAVLVETVTTESAHGGSETESDTETRVLDHREPKTVETQAKRVETIHSREASWEHRVDAALAAGLVITTEKNRPTTEIMVHYVSALQQVLQQVEVPPRTEHGYLTNRRLGRLLKQMISVFNRGKKVPALAPVTAELLLALESVGARDATLKQYLSVYMTRLEDLKLHMEGLAPRRRPHLKK